MTLRRREDGRGDALPLDVLLDVLLYESSIFQQLSTRMKVVLPALLCSTSWGIVKGVQLLSNRAFFSALCAFKKNIPH